MFSYAYMSWSIGRTLSSPLWAWLAVAIPFLGIIIYPLLFFASRQRTRQANASPRPSALQWLAYFSMAGLSFLLPLVIARDCLVLGLSFFAPTWTFILLTSTTSFLLLGGGILLLVFGAYVGMSGPRLHKIRVNLSQLHADRAASLQGLTIAQISDLHVGPTINRPYVQNVVDKTNSINPDLIVLTGDIADGPFDIYANEIEPLRNLRAKYGVYFVMGNHEYYWDGPRWLKHMEELGMKTLSNQSRIFDVQGASVAIIGVLDPAASIARSDDGPDLAKAMTGAASADFKILLAHHPGIFDQARAQGVDLQLSGHTHGGQFFPWNLVVRKVHKYYQGLSELGKMQIYVSPGTGSWGPPIRLGTRPEITELILGEAGLDSELNHGSINDG
jgi:predicted MPP superfamily phosphohydrolase